MERELPPVNEHDVSVAYYVWKQLLRSIETKEQTTEQAEAVYEQWFPRIPHEGVDSTNSTPDLKGIERPDRIGWCGSDGQRVEDNGVGFAMTVGT